MKTGDLTKLIEADSNLDQNNLDLEALKIPYLHAKYYKIFIDEFKILKSLELETGKIKKERIEYYLGKAPDEVYKENPMDHKILKADIDLYLNADDKLMEFEGKRIMQKAKVDMLEAFLKTLSNRSFMIKNAIDFMKFKNGLS